MIFTLAWRNVWRNKIRSLVVIIALATGLLGAMYIAAMTNGMLDKWIQTSIDNEISDIQIHEEDYLILEDVRSYFTSSKTEVALEEGLEPGQA